MPLVVMRSIEYNTWMSILDGISKELPNISENYGLTGITIEVMPSYPKDLSKFVKPSIIVQKISTDHGSVGFGNFLGQYYEESENALYDILGSIHNIVFQMNVEGEGNIQCSLLTSAIMEGILQRIHYGDLEIPLMDYIGDPKNPTGPIGKITFMTDDDVMDLSSNDNNDHINAIRFETNVVQSIAPPQDMVDLSKGFKYNQKINL